MTGYRLLNRDKSYLDMSGNTSPMTRQRTSGKLIFAISSDSNKKSVTQVGVPVIIDSHANT